MNLPVVGERALRDHVSEWLGDPRRKSRVKLVRAQPVWAGQPVLDVAGTKVHIAEGISGLAALDAIRATPKNEFVLVLTQLSRDELGSAVWLDAEKHRVATLDDWDAVPGYFGVRDHQVSMHVRALGEWVPGLLIAWKPERGYLPAPGGVLSVRHIARALLTALLGLDRTEDLDAFSTALTPFDDAGVRARLRGLDRKSLDGLVRAASEEIDPHFGLALRAAAAPGTVSPLAVGLVLAELWQEDSSSATAAARVRVERYVGTGPSAAAASRYGAAARTIITRWLELNPAEAKNVLDQAEAICADLDWADGAAASSFLLSGLRARVSGFAHQVSIAAAESTIKSSIAVDEAFTALKSHDASASIADSLGTAEMAVRAARWLATTADSPRSFGKAVSSFASDGAWAEWALGDLWSGDTDVALANAYRDLAHTIQMKRRVEDLHAASMLTGDAILEEGVIPIERLLSQEVVPLSTLNNVLVLVLDGMSVSTAAELVSELTLSGWNEIVRSATKLRDTAVAMLPTVTDFSRSSLFAGEPIAGNQQTEKSRFAAACNGVVFHKDDLRSDAGHALPPAVTRAIDNSKQKIVAAVLNTIDDALANADVDALRWNVGSVAHLRALLGEAAKSGRTVILTSDHGHVVERGGELQNIPGSPARWRTPQSGPVSENEVLVSGPRVLAPGGNAVLAVSDGIRYASKKAGYHGGASLSELAIPVAVLHPRSLSSPLGWIEAPPQEPIWWNERLRDADLGLAATPASIAPRTRKAKKPKHESPDVIALFDAVDETTPSHDASGVSEKLSLGEQLVQVAGYQDRREAGGRHPIDDADATEIVNALVAGGGRAHQDTLAARLGVAAYSFRGTLAALRRALNVDGYEVVRMDLDRVTVVLDEKLLREQFELGS